MSDEAFREAFGAEEQCRSALSRLRWPDGFVCPACGHRGHCVLAGRSLYQCYRCKKQTSSTAGTIFHATKLPLTLWFAAVHLIVTAKNGISSVELGRRLGVKQPTAWTMKHKIMAVMARREADTPLSGRVEMDDAYLGGARAGGKRGRGAPGKTPFVAAVSTSPEGRPRKVKLVPVKGFRKREIARGAKRWLAPGSEVLTDGLRCWNALDGVVGSHRAIRTGSGRQAARMAPFKWVNTTLGNIKSAITGTYPKLGPDHAQRYLASFAWRYNRRYQLNTMIPRFVHSAARTQPIPYHPIPSAHRWMTFMDKQELYCVHNLFHIYRLGQVLLETGLDAHCDVLGRGDGAERDDRDVLGLLQALQIPDSFEPIHAGKVDIEDDQVGGIALGQFDGQFGIVPRDHGTVPIRLTHTPTTCSVSCRTAGKGSRCRNGDSIWQISDCAEVRTWV